MNIYEQIRNELTNKQVAKFYLGEPQKYSGNSIGYCSPFRNEKHPSFWINDDKGFTDFAAKEYSGNMISFVKQYKNLDTYLEAAKQLVKDFNLDVKIEDNMSCYSKSRRKEKIEDIFFEESEKHTKIICMFDTIEHIKKPDTKEAAIIKNRISNLQMQYYNLDEILENIIKGKTIIPAGIKSNAKVNFKEQAVFLVDFDNTKNGQKLLVTDKEHTTINQILEYCRKINFMPTFAYYTFSHTEDQHKFRLGYVLSNAVTDYKIAEKIPKKLLEIFKDFNPDTSKQNLADFFYGGKEIAYRGNNFYSVSLLEGYTYTEEIEIVEDKYKKYNDILRKYGYEFSSKGLTRKIKKQDSCEDKIISNFLAIPIKYITHDNGKDSRTDVVIKGILSTGEELPEIIVDVNNIENVAWITNLLWKLKARISPNGNNKEYFKDAVKILGELASTETIYSHTGFRKVNGKLVYLYHSGAIGTDENIKVDLGDSGLEQYVFPEKEQNEKIIVDAIETSLKLLELSRETIMVPLIGLIFLSPVQEIFNKQGIANGFVTWILGESGTQKSTLAALLLSHFGEFERDTIPCGFKDTVNSLEKKAFILKDCPILIDDYFPSQSLQEERKMNAIAESIFRYGRR